MQHYLGVAKARGVTEDEIGAVESVVMAVTACRVRTQFADALAKSHEE